MAGSSWRSDAASRIGRRLIGVVMTCCGVPSRGTDGRTPAAPPGRPACETAPPPRVPIPSGVGQIGTHRPVIPVDGEGVVRRVRLTRFEMDAHAVSVARFAAFAADTGHVTEAETIGWSFVFEGSLPPRLRVDAPAVAEAPWWRAIDGACWHRPAGEAAVAVPLDHPAVHISWNDAAAFAVWAGGRLPTESEWEHAARGGQTDPRYPWGEAEPDDDRFQPCNIWQGKFPQTNLALDGYAGTAPVECFAPNAFGLFNMVGNVWEWCADPFRIRSLRRGARERSNLGKRIMKGGSYLCHRSYCHRYRIAARSGNEPTGASGHLGFRLVYDDAGAH